jgi:hypothetical protein
MEKGDISNEVSPRLVIVWEGLLALPPQKEDGGFRQWLTARQAGKTARMINAFDLNEEMAKHVWDMVWRRRFTIDCVTFLGDQYVDAIEKWIDKHDLPIARVTCDTPQTLARRLAYMPAVAAVYDPEPSRALTYGGKGRLMDPERPDFFGVN